MKTKQIFGIIAIAFLGAVLFFVDFFENLREVI